MVQHDFWFKISNSKELEKIWVSCNFSIRRQHALSNSSLRDQELLNARKQWHSLSNCSMKDQLARKYYWKLARNETRLHCSSCPTFQNDVSTFPIETRLEPSTTNVFRGRHLWPVEKVILQQRWPIFRDILRCWWHNRNIQRLSELTKQQIKHAMRSHLLSRILTIALNISQKVLSCSRNVYKQLRSIV